MLHFLRSVAQPIGWPSMLDVLKPNRRHKTLDKIKYTGRLLLARKHLGSLTQTLSSVPVWQQLYQTKPYFFQPPLSAFLDKRWNLARRYKQLSVDLHAAKLRFNHTVCQKIAAGDGITLFDCPEVLMVRLNANPLNVKEGHWALSLFDAQGVRLFNLSFGFLDDDTVLIASLQGTSSQIANFNTKERIVQLTKQCFGLRPQQLLFNVVQNVCASAQIKYLLGIDTRHHIYNLWHLKRRLKFNYQNFWKEMGAQLDADTQQASQKYWKLPLTANTKAIEDAPSHKRSQYKKRHELLAQMRLQVDLALNAAS